MIGFFLDAALSVPAMPASVLSNVNGAPREIRLWLGDPDAGDSAYVAESAPGVDQVEVSIEGAGTGQPVTSIALASSRSGLASATPGAPLELGLQIAAGPAGAVAFWVRWIPHGDVVDTYENLGLVTNALEVINT